MKGLTAVDIYDISMTIEPSMAVYKNRDEKKPRFINTRSFSNNSVFETRLDLDLHSGTHVDMPLHVLPDGSDSDNWRENNFFTPALVLDFSDLQKDRIGELELHMKEKELIKAGLSIKPGFAVLLKTVNSRSEHFSFQFTFLEAGGAAYLADKKISGVGLDALGIERDQPGHLTHKTLLTRGIWILEGLRLEKPRQGLYTLALLPLKIGGVEALPARALLLPFDQEICRV